MEKTGLRMYFFVMYNLSGIQKGIQAGHAALEYANTFGDSERYKEFINNHKTFILLDGGGSNAMRDRATELWQLAFDFASFQEPDLNNSTSALSFIVPETYYNYNEETDGYDPHKQTVFDWLKSFRLASN